MKKFSFGLQKLLNLEEQREQQEKLRMQSLVNKLRAQEEILEFLKVSLYNNQKMLAGRKEVLTNAHQIALYQNYIIALNERIDFQINKVNEVDAEIGNCRNDLLIVQKSRKMVENLKDKDKQGYLVSIRKAEAKEIDEINTSRQFAR